MSAPERASREAWAPPRLTIAARAQARPEPASLVRAILASTFQRVQRGEGALLAVNLSLIVFGWTSLAFGVAEALVSLLAIGLMYAFNDLYDAPADWNNPKKDRSVIAAYVRHRRVAAFVLLGLHVVAVVFAGGALGSRAAGAVAAVMVVNVVYSTVLKGVPVLDVVWCGLWGALYASIVSTSASLLVVVGLMTGVCHLFQALDDREPDAANGISTTAVRSAVLSHVVLVGLSLLLFVVLREPLGTAAALSAFTPLVLAMTVPNAGTGWLLTKAYFGALWLWLLGSGALS